VGNAGISWLGHAYHLTVGAGLPASLAVIPTALPLLRRITDPGDARFEQASPSACDPSPRRTLATEAGGELVSPGG
jgi:hypothetical protein